MHLRSLSLKGFKSFPDRTRLEFAPGVSVVVGPNGSGKSNITDAVLWALGEQSPLAVRGHTMKDVIFAGGHGLKSSKAAEVEVVIDNADGELDSEFSEISIVRRVDRTGDGEYRLNGARCRLVDVLEVLSDSGLGKEMHSVVSQGRVEAIVLSKPRDRRLLIEEAAGLGKHRKRRRRAQLKLERTEDNLSRALDVEREARSRLRPLKRQAEAAEQHRRLERQQLEARMELQRDRLRCAREQLSEAEVAATAARAERAGAEAALKSVADRREQAELAFAEQSQQRDQLQARLYAARSAVERIELRLERARERGAAAAERSQRRGARLEALRTEPTGADGPGGAERAAVLEAELAQLDRGREERLERQLGDLRAQRAGAEAERSAAQEAGERLREELDAAARAVESARAARANAERALESARAGAARAGAELATVNQLLRAASGTTAGARSLADDLDVDAGYELALAAALGPRLGAGVVEDIAAGHELLDAAGDDGGYALIALRIAPAAADEAPCEGAERLLDHVHPAPTVAAAARRLLGSTWVVGELDRVPEGFGGIAVTRAGRVLHATTGELLQAPSGGAERLLEQRNRRTGLIAAAERAARGEAEARAEVERAVASVTGCDAAREEAEVAVRRALRELDGATDSLARLDWLIERRHTAPDDGPDAVRRAELAAELRGELAAVERHQRERRERERLLAGLAAGIEADGRVAAAADRAAAGMEAAGAVAAAVAAELGATLTAGAEEGRRTAELLRECAHEEAGLQDRLRRGGEAVTTAEVAAQQTRDTAADAEAELRDVAGRLGLEPEPAEEQLAEDERAHLEARVERLTRRREQLGPVNPLAATEYEQAVAHVEELERQRRDLEGALAELQGIIKDTDRRIRERFEQTFEAAARNFEEVVEHLFPGGRGRLRLVAPDGPRPVLGGEAESHEEPDRDAARETEADAAPAPLEPGVEVEVTPAGKAMKRLSLLSGGEKSLVALAFMFAIFLARPCPFYILDEVEAALDDVNIDRFLALLRRYSDRAQFIVVTHQKHTMDAADRLYGVSMGGDGVSHVVSRKLDRTGDGSQRGAGSEEAA